MRRRRMIGTLFPHATAGDPGEHKVRPYLIGTCETISDICISRNINIPQIISPIGRGPDLDDPCCKRADSLLALNLTTNAPVENDPPGLNDMLMQRERSRRSS